MMTPPDTSSSVPSAAQASAPLDAFMIAGRILADMRDGVLSIDLTGKIITFNPAAQRMLGMTADDVADKSFGEVFLEFDSNDDFNQAVLDAIYDASTTHHQQVTFTNPAKPEGEQTVTLSLTTSFLQTEVDGLDNKRIGVIAVFNDITEVTALQASDARMALEMKAQHHALQEAFRATEGSNAKLAEALKKVQVTRVIVAVSVLLLGLGTGLLYWRQSGHSGAMPLSVSATVDTGASNGNASNATSYTVVPQAMSSRVALTGKLQPLQTVNVNTPLTGRVGSVNFQYGDVVAAGQVLVVMDTSEALVKSREARSAFIKANEAYQQVLDWEHGPDMTGARRSLTRAKLALDAQRKSLDENERLFAKGIIPANDYESAKQQFTGQQLDYQAAEEDLKAMRNKGKSGNLEVARIDMDNAQVRLRQVEAEMAQATVRSPVAGIVLKPSAGGGGSGGSGGGAGKPSKLALKGESFQQGEILLAIGDLAGLSVATKVDEVDVTKLRQGQKAQVTGDAFPGITLVGTVRNVSPLADEGESRGLPSFVINVTVDSVTPEQRQRTLVGMSANLEILTYEKPDALMVPVAAVLVDAAGKRAVRRKKADGGVEEVPVQTGYTTLDAVEITQGLKAGDVVELLPAVLPK